MNKKLFLGILALGMIFIIGCQATGQGGGTNQISLRRSNSLSTPQRCFSDSDCRNTICPQVVGQDTPYCNTASSNNKRCACGPSKIPSSSGSSGGSSMMVGGGTASSSGGIATGGSAGSGACKMICLQDMKRCSDGSLVGRDPCHNCQFEDCTSRAPPDDTTLPSQSTLCPKDLKQCPDGSFVVRNPESNCAFNPCTSTGANTDRFHPADTNEDWEINLGEITSFISLAIRGAKLGGYYKWEITSNGLGDWSMTNAPPAGISDGRASRFHPADANNDWNMDIGEITKFVNLALKAETLFTGGGMYKWNSQLQDWANP